MPDPLLTRGGGPDPPDDVWAPLADVLLQRAALVARVARQRAPDPLAGLKVDDADVANLLAELPGLERPDNPSRADIEEQLAPPVAEARAAFAQRAGAHPTFGRLVVSAQLTPIEVEVLPSCTR